MSLNSKALGLALGTVAALVWLAMMGFSLLTGVGDETIRTLGSYHPFFSYTFLGLIAMIIEHFVGGFILGWLFGKFYHHFAKAK